MLLGRNSRLLLLVFVFLVVVFASYFVKTVYVIKARAVFMPSKDYVLIRTAEGNLITSFKDNKNSTTLNYGITEFQRGDVVEFVLANNISEKTFINEGDTIGWVYSNEEQRKLIQLKGQLQILKAEQLYFTTGQKPEDVSKAKEQLDLAKQEFITQEKLMSRSKILFTDTVISEQEFEIEENKFNVKLIALKIAEANYASITTGEKPEQEKLVKTQIAAIEDQIEQLTKRLNYFTIVSPLSGIVIKERGDNESEKIISVGAIDEWVAVIPLQLKEMKYVKVGDTVSYFDLKGEIIQLDNKINLIDYKQAFYITTTWPNSKAILPGIMYEVNIECEKISLLHYFLRLFEIDGGAILK
jgi:biotin carboxyl carrier protein